MPGLKIHLNTGDPLTLDVTGVQGRKWMLGMFRKMESISGTLGSSTVECCAFAVDEPAMPSTVQLLLSLKMNGLLALKHSSTHGSCLCISLLLHCKLPHLVQGGLHSRTVDSFV